MLDGARNPFLNPNYRTRPDVQKKTALVQQAHDTLAILSAGRYIDADGAEHAIADSVAACVSAAALYDADSGLLADWSTGPRLAPSPSPRGADAQPEFLPASALTALHALPAGASIGVLHSSHPRRPGGAFLAGGDDSESVLARGSALPVVLASPPAKQFFAAHHGPDSLHAHHFLYAPDVPFFRDGSGRRVPPVHASIVSAVPVNVQSVLSQNPELGPDVVRARVDPVMRERMARILRLFEERGHTHLVLGMFGAELQNTPEALGRLWAELLGVDNAPFRGKFEKVIFAVPGKPGRVFKQAFELRVYEDELTRAMTEMT